MSEEKTGKISVETAIEYSGNPSRHDPVDLGNPAEVGALLESLGALDPGTRMEMVTRITASHASSEVIDDAEAAFRDDPRVVANGDRCRIHRDKNSVSLVIVAKVSVTAFIDTISELGNHARELGT